MNNGGGKQPLLELFSLYCLKCEEILQKNE